MNLPLTRARTPGFTGAVATVLSLTSTDQTPRCPRANLRLGRKPAQAVKPGETRGNPGSLTSRDEPPSIVVSGCKVTICVPNLNDEPPPLGVHRYTLICCRRFEVSYLRTRTCKTGVQLRVVRTPFGDPAASVSRGIFTSLPASPRAWPFVDERYCIRSIRIALFFEGSRAGTPLSSPDLLPERGVLRCGIARPASEDGARH
jgi:hypothetical protein